MLPNLHGPSARRGEGETREAYDVVAGPSLDHRDDVEQLLGHQGLRTPRRFSTQMKQSLKSLEGEKA